MQVRILWTCRNLDLKNSSMKILIVNVGSSSVKYSLFDSGRLLDERVFSRKESFLTFEEKEFLRSLYVEYFVFRVVHGKDKTATRFIDSNTYEDIKAALPLAPIHNKLLLELLDFVLEEFGKDKSIAVFDSDFHKTLPKKAYLYPVKRDYAEKHSLRKYGFHGIAFEAALSELENRLGTVPENVIAIHAGGGVSVCAIKDGASVYTSMGLTPTDGIMMLTRSGSLDPELVRVLQERENLLPSEVSRILNFESGFYGMTGSKDTKEIIEKAKEGKEPFKSAYELFLYELKKRVFAYLGVLGAVDTVLLSGGLAYNNEYFADDLYAEIKHLPVRKEQMIKVDIDENKIMLKKARELILSQKNSA